MERRLIGLSLARIGVAGVVLAYLLGQWPDRHLLWGPDGVYPSWLFAREVVATRTPSLLATDSLMVFETLYGLTVAFAMLYLIGWRTLPVGIAFAILSWSLLRRNPFAITGGDSLLLLMLPWMVVANTSAYLSVDSGWRGIGSTWRPAPRPWRALLNNGGVVGILLQLATMYLFAGVHKLFGAPWLNGSAAGAVLRVDRFSLPGLSPAIAQHELAGQLLTLWTLVFELTAPVLLWLPGTRWLVAAQSVLFHGGIGVLMGLVLFAVEAMLFQAVLFPDASYRRLYERLAALGRLLRTSARVGRAVRA